MSGMAVPAYRIEHHREGGARLILAFRDDASQSEAALAPHAERLIAGGETRWCW
jgi:hypothetical protein